eukprot:764869-Hanusia_phi.AAC.2
MWCPDNRDLGNMNAFSTTNIVQTGILSTPSSNSAESQDSSVVDTRVFRQGSSVCIFELFPEEYMNSVIVNLEVFARNCPVGSAASSSIIGLKYGALERGVLPPKKAVADKRDAGGAGNRFQHQVQIRMRQDGAENISVKFFKTGRLQTAGCKTRAMSVAAVMDVAEAIAMMSNKDPPLLLVSNCERSIALELARMAPRSVRVVKECILGSFNSGFGGQYGSIIDMNSLFVLLKSGRFSDVIERVKFNDEPGSHEAKFKQLGLYLKRSCLINSDSDVFVNIFSSGKCTITAATSMELANEVMNKVSDILCNNYDSIAFRPKQESDPLFSQGKTIARSSKIAPKINVAEDSLGNRTFRSRRKGTFPVAYRRAARPSKSRALKLDFVSSSPGTCVMPKGLSLNVGTKAAIPFPSDAAELLELDGQPGFAACFEKRHPGKVVTDELPVTAARADRSQIHGPSHPTTVWEYGTTSIPCNGSVPDELVQYGNLGLQYPQRSVDSSSALSQLHPLLQPLPQRPTAVNNLMDAMRGATSMPLMSFVPAMSPMGLNLVTPSSQAPFSASSPYSLDHFSAGAPDRTAASLGFYADQLVEGGKRKDDEEQIWHHVNSVQSKKPRIEEP